SVNLTQRRARKKHAPRAHARLFKFSNMQRPVAPACARSNRRPKPAARVPPKSGRAPMTMYVHDRMLELMEAEGIKTLFGIPDPSSVAMFIAAEARGWRVIAPHHEQAGAFMADGMWRMTGVPGAIVGNQGPGVANLAAAAICAAKENVPT